MPAEKEAFRVYCDGEKDKKSCKCGKGKNKKALPEDWMYVIVNNPALTPSEKREIIENFYAVEYENLYENLKEHIFKQVRVFEMSDKKPFVLYVKSDLYKGAYSVLINSGLEEEYKKWKEEQKSED